MLSFLNEMERETLESAGLLEHASSILKNLKDGKMDKLKANQQISAAFSVAKNRLADTKNKQQKLATGVMLEGGDFLPADIVCSNADYAHTYKQLVDAKHRFWNSNFKIEKITNYSMSLFVLYFAFKKTETDDLRDNLRHHNIIFGKDYIAELNKLFDTGELNSDFSQYLHIPTLTDPEIAPSGYHLAYTLVCVPNKSKLNQDWSEIEESFAQKILNFLEEKKYIPNLNARLVYKSWITPDYFEKNLNSFAGNSFGVAPVFRQSAFFRPHNQSEDISNLYLVGANTQPGAGTPSVMMSAKMTAKSIAKNHL